MNYGPEDSTLTLTARFILETTTPRPNENGDVGYFLKLDISAEDIGTNEELFNKIVPNIPKIEINSHLYGEHDLKKYLTPVINPFGEQKPHISIGWFGAFHVQSKPELAIDESIVSRAKAISGELLGTFTLNLTAFSIVSSSGLRVEEVKDGIFTPTASLLGKERDTILGFNLPDEMNDLVLKKAKEIFGEDFKQTGLGGKEVPFHLTVAQTLLRPKLTMAAPILTERKVDMESIPTESEEPTPPRMTLTL